MYWSQYPRVFWHLTSLLLLIIFFIDFFFISSGRVGRKVHNVEVDWDSNQVGTDITVHYMPNMSTP